MSNRHAQHMEVIANEDHYARRVHQLPNWARAIYQFEREFPSWNDYILTQMKTKAYDDDDDAERLRQEALGEYEDAIERTLGAGAGDGLPGAEAAADPLSEFIANVALPGVDMDKSSQYMEDLLGSDMLRGDDESELPASEAGMDPLDLAGLP